MSPKKRIDKDTVIRTAAAILEKGGADGLSLTRLAEKLGIQTPSLYNHIDGLAGLQRELSLLSARNLANRMEQAAIGRSGSQAILAIAQAYREYIKSAPALYQYTLRASGNRTQKDPELEAVEERSVRIVLVVVESFGLRGDDAIHAVRGLRSLIHGFASLEVAGGFGMPLDCDESFRRLLEIYIRGLPDSSTAQAGGLSF
ncbi:transcriptional regulator, TetR family [Longilinea arvoryzae]|uniref:Transcriptional regulator, TetR family n=1 Tax=Longilinea arvoryzae TaxID=360412 RepID=A0A0S7B9G0_9CHLR|nr:TetR-like C-terminal domain-containing protein [Longilinea arvoryzae]GAP13918.1 transcriptional regulator, TetR family [Longilinea arvoryzae]